jgi:hypothetical protein
MLSVPRTMASSPNNPKLPLALYRSPVRLSGQFEPAAVFAAMCEELFESNGWGDSWRNWAPRSFFVQTGDRKDISPCRALGVVDLIQEGINGPVGNPRVILMPVWHDRMGELEKASDLSLQLKERDRAVLSQRDIIHCQVGEGDRLAWAKAADKLISASLIGKSA